MSSESASTVRICADDVNAALVAKGGITLGRRPFTLAEGATGVRLEPSKRKLVALTTKATVRDLTCIRAIRRAGVGVRLGIVDGGLPLRFSGCGRARFSGGR